MNFPEGGRYPKIFQRGLPCISSGPQFVDSSRPHLCRYTPSWAHALLSSAPALSPAAQDMVLSRGQPESSPPTAYWMSCAIRPPQTMEPWPNRRLELQGWRLAGPHPHGPGGFGPAYQHRTVAMVAEPCQVRVTSPPVAWPRHQITGPCHSRGEGWVPACSLGKPQACSRPSPAEELAEPLELSGLAHSLQRFLCIRLCFPSSSLR